MVKPTTDPGADSLSWERGSRGGQHVRFTTFSLHCVSSLGLCTLVLFWKPCSYTWQAAERQQLGEKHFSIIFSWQLISDDFQSFSSCSLLYWILTHTMSPSPWACPVNINQSGLQMQARENSTTQPFTNCCFSSITLARSLWFDCRTSPPPPACWFLKCFLSIDSTVTICKFWFLFCFVGLLIAVLIFLKIIWFPDFIKYFVNPSVHVWPPGFSACLV